MIRLLLISSLICCLVSCSSQPKNDEVVSKVAMEENTNETAPPETMTPADLLLKRTVEAHGGERYLQAEYIFTFRKKDYRFKNTGDQFRYESTQLKDGITTVDVLENGNFSRSVNGEAVELTAKQIAAGQESLNSVIYFATLPNKLNDPAVNLNLGESTTINGQQYQSLVVHFDQEGGGTDHDDNFCYWINDKTGRIDFLAYDYQTNGGGVRFRSAYNPRTVNGIIFQDYVNYKAPVGTDLNELPALYEAGKLKELSRIETEDVVSLN